MSERLEYSREAARITLDKVDAWDELNAASFPEANEKFAGKTRELWQEFAVSGKAYYDRNKGKHILYQCSDLDGEATQGILKMAGINMDKLTYVNPGESLAGAINIETGYKLGVVYEPETKTAWFDHHQNNQSEVTSTAEIMYQTLVSLGLMEKSLPLDRTTDFVTKIDNREYPAEAFLKRGRILLGLHKYFPFNKLVEYFTDHTTPLEEISPEEIEKWGLTQASRQMQMMVDHAMRTLTRMEQAGKVVETQFGRVVVNENMELKAGASAAYVRHDGILNLVPGVSFTLYLKSGRFNETYLRYKLGEKFQGKIIRGNIWKFNHTPEELKLTREDILEAIKPHPLFKFGRIRDSF